MSSSVGTITNDLPPADWTAIRPASPMAQLEHVVVSNFFSSLMNRLAVFHLFASRCRSRPKIHANAAGIVTQSKCQPKIGIHTRLTTDKVSHNQFHFPACSTFFNISGGRLCLSFGFILFPVIGFHNPPWFLQPGWQTAPQTEARSLLMRCSFSLRHADFKKSLPDRQSEESVYDTDFLLIR